jgi:large subunit ribosomal protein L15
MNLHTMKPTKGSTHKIKRLGKGESSGQGKTAGKGHKGQKARSGGGVRVGFEGGQMPIHRRLPKRGFNNVRFADKVVVVNTAHLEKFFEAGATVNEESLRAKGLVKGAFDQIKVLGNGVLTKKLTISVSAISAGAKAKIEAAGGTIA